MDAQLYNRFLFFRFILLFILSSGMTVVQVAATEPGQKKDPEAVYVAVEKARLYAGPSSDFYPTGDSKRGTPLEVYHRTENGWLGVRPPQGSFSWVPASQAYLLPGGRVIEITDANSVSWIGTELGSAKQYRWQVQLKVGEQLSVLDEATIKNETDDREALWYKVSPPAGEFRWIEQAAVSKTAPPVKLNDTQSESPLTAKEVASQITLPQSKLNESSIVEAKRNGAEKAAVRSASFERPAASATPGSNVLSSKSKNAKAGNSKTPNSSGTRAPGNEWDGWYAFEMSEQGVRTPFLDKLSGRDRGKASKLPQTPASQHDPLIHDPFSLAMAGEPQKPSPSELNSVVKKEREWRDPRSLREARLGSSAENSRASLAARRDHGIPSSAPASSSSSSSGVLLASSDASQNVGTSAGVNTAGYEMQPMDAAQADPRANVNWYGIAESSSVTVPNASTNGPLNVVTSTADVGELQLALNNAVASSNGPWNLAPLAERARYLIEHGPTAIDRGQARLLLERIDAFQSVSARTQQFSGPTPLQTSPVQTSPVQTSPVQSTSFNAATRNLSLPNSPQAASATYDATGWLVPVHAAGPDQPTHALTNDTGDVISYVSPIAGLNLDRYRNQAVGINGLRGYLPQLQAAHIQAQRVSRVR